MTIKCFDIDKITVGQIGKGFVGGALCKSFEKKGVDTIVYDKFQKIGTIEDVVECDIVFLCLPTPFMKDHGFDLGAIRESLDALRKKKFDGLCVIKSTIEPGVTSRLASEYSLNIAHNPEFLTERTAFDDFHNQAHIVLGKVYDSDLFDFLILFYKNLYPKAKLSVCTSYESEAMKLFCNNFYAAKVMIFNEFYSLCEKLNINYDEVKSLMLENGWINEMHTSVPGPDGKVGFGGNCFIKDTHALVNFMKKTDCLSDIFEAVVEERNKLRTDMTNVIDKPEGV